KIEWFPVLKLPVIGYDNEKIIKKAIIRVRNKIGYSNISCHLLPKEFTLTQLQEIYEAVLNRKLDKRNFRRKILNLGIIKEAGGKKYLAANRPAGMYKFVSKKYQEVELL
ncbi:MAG: NUDIX hydrolase, partial [Candidatus Cloacimonetes bacterium]|nr:NUDIX hydrolase [Candidatus Cloacimonadota bacterium]